MKSLQNYLSKWRDYFFISSGCKLHKVFYIDISYLEGMKDYTKVHPQTTPIT
jgi:hypothetical protein